MVQGSEDDEPGPQEGIERGLAREERARERHARALTRAAEDRERAEALTPGPARERLEHAVRTHERAAELHDEAARLQRLHQVHEAERADEQPQDD